MNIMLGRLWPEDPNGRLCGAIESDHKAQGRYQRRDNAEDQGV
jgi:hypothetical protein